MLSLSDLDADLPNVAPALHVLVRCNDIFVRESKDLFYWHLESFAAHKSNQIFSKLLGANIDASDNAALVKHQAGNIGHLLSCGQEPNHGDLTSTGTALDALRDRAGATIFEDEVDSLASSNLVGFIGPLWGLFVVDDIINSVLFLSYLELVVGRRRDDCGGAGCLGKYQSSHRDAAGALEENCVAWLEGHIAV